MNYRGYFHKLFHLVWSLFLNGLLTLLPMALTVAIFSSSFKLLVGWLTPVQRLVHATPLGWIPYAEVMVSILCIFVVGLIVRIFIFRSILDAIEHLISKIPLIRQIYAGLKQLVNAFNVQDKLSFKQVVLVEFPRPGVYSLGFVTSELPVDLAPVSSTVFFNVFIPTTPNPTSGFFVILPEKDIVHIDISRQEAMSMIISGGIIQPQRFSNGGAKKS